MEQSDAGAGASLLPKYLHLLHDIIYLLFIILNYFIDKFKKFDIHLNVWIYEHISHIIDNVLTHERMYP